VVWVALAAVAVLAASWLLGAAVWRIAGLDGSSHIAPITGFATLLVLVLPAVFLPGHAWNGLILAAVLTLAAAAVPGVRRDARAGIADGLPVMAVALLALLLPFIVSGHFGILGMGNNDDWTMHLIVVRWLAHHEIPVGDTVVDVGYPVGPHAIAASLTALGFTAPQALTAVMAAGPVLGARAALSVLGGVRRPVNWALAVVAGLSYLGAAYYAQASHKEVLAAVPILGFALTLPAVARAVAAGGRAEAIRAALPPALLIVGATQIISGGAALWPLGTFGLWAVIELFRRRHVRAEMVALVRRALPAVVAGAVITLILQAPEITRLIDFQSSHFANEPDGGVGNLGGRLPPWKALGVWLNPDFRFATHLPVLTALLLVGAAILIVVAVVHWLRRGPSSLAAALITSWGLWIGLSLFRNPYNAAKGLAMMAPLVGLALITGAVLAWSLRGRLPALRTAVRAGTAAVIVAAGISTFLALRDGIVGPDAHAAELRSIEATAKTGPTAFLEQSDYGGWDLFALRPYRPTLLYKVNVLPTRPEKDWHQGMTIDLDGMTSATLNRFKWIVSPNTSFASFPPPGLRIVRRTPSWILWERTGTVPPRDTLNEGWRPGAVLDCTTPAGRSLSRRTGTATVRTPPVIARRYGWNGYADDAGSTSSRTLDLPPGRWDLSLQYQSRNPMTITAPRMHRRMPANLDRMGSFFNVGTVTGGGPVKVQVKVDELGLIGRLLGSRGQTRALNSPGFHALGELAATPHGERPQRIPLARACGRYVDSYTLG
jgi:hypothetical protein